MSATPQAAFAAAALTGANTRPQQQYHQAERAAGYCCRSRGGSGFRLPGDVYVADGYGNARIVVFNPAMVSSTNPYGYVGQWGTSCGHNETPNGTTFPGNPCPLGTFGTGAGHPHCVVLGTDGLVYTCDRPNGRIEVFEKTCAAFGPQPPPAMDHHRQHGHEHQTNRLPPSG